MKRKITMFLAVMMLVVAMFAVPTMAADESMIQVNPYMAVSNNELAELQPGEVITKTIQVVDSATGATSEIISEIGLAPVTGIATRDIGAKNGWFFNKITNKLDNNNYAYGRYEFILNSNKIGVKEARAAVAVPQEGYFATGSTGNMSIVGNYGNVVGSGSGAHLYHSADFVNTTYDEFSKSIYNKVTAQGGAPYVFASNG